MLFKTAEVGELADVHGKMHFYILQPVKCPLIDIAVCEERRVLRRQR